MAKDLRTFLAQLQEACPEELLRVPGKINSSLEATTFLRKMELEGKAPMTVFEHPTALDGSDSAFPLVFNAFSTRKKFCAALGLDMADYKMPLSMELKRRFANRIQPETTPAEEAPVKEVILKGEKASFAKLGIEMARSEVAYSVEEALGALLECFVEAGGQEEVADTDRLVEHFQKRFPVLSEWALAVFNCSLLLLTTALMR